MPPDCLLTSLGRLTNGRRTNDRLLMTARVVRLSDQPLAAAHLSLCDRALDRRSSQALERALRSEPHQGRRADEAHVRQAQREECVPPHVPPRLAPRSLPMCPPPLTRHLYLYLWTVGRGSHPAGSPIAWPPRLPRAPSSAEKPLRPFARPVVAALLDHKWLELILEGSQYCGLCSCVSFCY